MGAIIGTAGWSIPASESGHFPAEGTALERYAARFRGVEINSSFHRPHRASTWARWAESVPAGFRFAVKVPKAITHASKLVDCGDLAAGFVEETRGLGEKLGILLVQLPPKLALDGGIAQGFFEHLSGLTPATIVCEPRHPSWFEAKADAVLDSLGVARAAADPAVVPAAGLPGGWRGLGYWRLHGSPAMYRSAYDEARLDAYAAQIRAEPGQAWCMFDNTAASAATGDALKLMARL
jgi:uncharacterized protein YecE (DUF72 family)